MMKPVVYAALLTLATCVAVVLAMSPNAANAAFRDNRPLPIAGGLVFGAYDPHGDFTDDPNSQIEQLFMPWEDVDISTLAAADDYAQSRHRSLLITVEPWSWAQDKHLAPAQLRDGIAAGRYDGNIAAICGTVSGFRTPTTIRWAQEMEDPSGRFIWAGWHPADYIAAYRRFVGKCRASAPNVAFMWSPRGDANLGAYYPGDDVVDVIGLSVFGLQARDHQLTGHDLTFADLLLPGYRQAARFGKPIYVAEMGYSGDTAYVGQWAATVLEKRAEFPLLKGVVYFDDRDVIGWADRLGIPEWRVTSNITDAGAD
jgi:beta-mannanase